MTAVVESQIDQTAPIPVVHLEHPHPQQRRRWVRNPRRIAMLAAAVFVLLLAVSWAFEDPLAHVWYQARQQSLATSLAGKRKRDSKGQGTAVLQIPRINLNRVVVQGDGPAELRGGPGHRISTPAPGAIGNSLIFGHRSGWGGSFSKLSKVQVNDDIVVKNRTGEFPLLFHVVAVRRVSAHDTRLLGPSTDHRLTLVTNSGGLLSSTRLVVIAVSGGDGHLVAQRSRVPAESGHGSDLFNAASGLLVVLIGGAVQVVRHLRGSHRRAMAVMAATPLALSALLVLLLLADVVVFPAFH